MVFPGNDGLELGQHIGADHHRIHEIFRVGPVAAFSADLNMEEIVGGASRPFL